MSVSPTKASPSKSRAEILSPRKKSRADDAGDEGEDGSGSGTVDRAKKNKKGLWNLFNAEYEI